MICVEDGTNLKQTYGIHLNDELSSERGCLLYPTSVVPGGSLLLLDEEIN